MLLCILGANLNIIFINYSVKMVLNYMYSEGVEQLILRIFFSLEYVFLGKLGKLILELFTKL